MPTFERLTAEELNRRSPQEESTEAISTRDYVLAYLTEGRFEVLNPTQRVIFAFAYVAETHYTSAEIGKFFDPPKATRTISQYKFEGFRKLQFWQQFKNPYNLSNRTYNALCRSWAMNIPWDELNNMSDEELLDPPVRRRYFGVKALKELREKMATQPATSGVAG